MSKESPNRTTIGQAIDSFLLSCKVEGKSCGTIDCYADKLKDFLWYAKNYNLPNDIAVRYLLSTLESFSSISERLNTVSTASVLGP